MWGRSFLAALISTAATSLFKLRKASAAPEKVLRIAVSFADIRLTTRQPSQGRESAHRHLLVVMRRRSQVSNDVRPCLP